LDARSKDSADALLDSAGSCTKRVMVVVDTPLTVAHEHWSCTYPS
jgi:hypothetical protein